MKVLVKSDSSLKYAFIKCDLEVIFYLYFIHTFCKDCNWMFHSVVLLLLFLLYLLHVQFLNASECFASSAHEPSLLDDDKSVCKEPMFGRVFPLKVGLQRSVILLKWDAGCFHCTLLHFIIEYFTITPIANYCKIFHYCSSYTILKWDAHCAMQTESASSLPIYWTFDLLLGLLSVPP